MIQVHSVKARVNPSFLGPAKGEFKYKQEVLILAQKDAFVRVKGAASGGPAIEGWIPRSALTTPEKFKLKQGSAVPLSKAGAMAAGKGLNVGGTAGNSAAGGSIDMEQVDRVEAATPEREGEVENFIQSGALKRGSR